MPGVFCITEAGKPHADHYADGGIIWDNTEFVPTVRASTTQKNVGPSTSDLRRLARQVKNPPTPLPTPKTLMEVFAEEEDRLAAEQLVSANEVGKWAGVHPDTSVVAAHTANVKGQKARLLEFVSNAGEDGLTCYEASHLMGLSPNQTATRMMELREMGLVVRLDVTRPTTPGNRGHVHVSA